MANKEKSLKDDRALHESAPPQHLRMSSSCIRTDNNRHHTFLLRDLQNRAIMESASTDNARLSRTKEIWVRNEDDWSGISDSKARRRIQNRRNQRALRWKRRTGADITTTDGSKSLPLPAQHGHMDLDIETVAFAIRSVNILDPRSERNQVVMQEFESFAYRCYAEHAPAIAFRPSLSQYNFIRALWANVEVLGFSSCQMSDDEALSPFNTSDFHQREVSRELELRVPSALRPTELQRAILHHPWIDLIPIPEMRDNIFRRGFESFDEEELCHDMRGRVHQEPGVLVWRDPWDLDGWEVTEAFVQTWGWTMTGCHDLFRSTNKWRARRGEKPLFRLPLLRD